MFLVRAMYVYDFLLFCAWPWPFSLVEPLHYKAARCRESVFSSPGPPDDLQRCPSVQLAWGYRNVALDFKRMSTILCQSPMWVRVLREGGQRTGCWVTLTNEAQIVYLTPPNGAVFFWCTCTSTIKSKSGCGSSLAASRAEVQCHSTGQSKTINFINKN